jgi:hypothetical protein
MRDKRLRKQQLINGSAATKGEFAVQLRMIEEVANGP